MSWHKASICLLLDTANYICCVTLQTMSAVAKQTSSVASHGRRSLLGFTADIVCSHTQQTSSVESHSRHWWLHHAKDIACCVTRQTLPAVSRNRRCLPCLTANMAGCRVSPHGVDKRGHLHMYIYWDIYILNIRYILVCIQV